MKKIILLGAILFLGPAGWGEMDAGTTPAADGTSLPPVHHKKKHKKDPKTGSQPADSQKAGSPSPANPQSVNPPYANPKSVTPVATVLDPVLPAPARTVLDEVVLETNALSPLTPTLSPQEGRGRNSATGEGSSPPTLRAWIAGQLIQSSPLDVSLSGGIQTFRSITSPAVALRIQRPGSPWFVEAGAAIPEYAGGDFQLQQETIDSTLYSAHVHSFYEVHLTANYELPHDHEEWIVPDVGFGVSMLSVSDQISTLTPYTLMVGGTPYTYQWYSSYGTTNYSFSPLFRLGVTLFPAGMVSIRSDIAYIGYANTASAAGAGLPAGRQVFDLGFSGVMYRALVQVRL
jgi:hypothetical protein